jgi:hypothetical protein
MILKHFVFSGKVLIPGTRKVEALRGVRVIAPSMQEASKDMVIVLTEKFGKYLPHKQTFSPGYAIAYLQPKEVASAEVTAPAPKAKQSNAKPSKLAQKKEAAKVRTGGIPKGPKQGQEPKAETTTA